ncbi:MAG: RpiB/LacA/LacB family sugar-phosphate isomerase [Clostridiales bacterium]|nr:RpiB/LacA/LacB family sugar-phosphate isomerase [Clostridiales bacterium]
MIVLAYDHRGYNIMLEIKKYLDKKNIEYIEYASKEYDKADNYAEYAMQGCEKMLELKNAKGIFCCGTGIGICMRANRYKGIRAGVCHDVKTTFLARNDDDINVLVLAGNSIKISKAKKMIDTFLSTPFEGGRHNARLKLLDI